MTFSRFSPDSLLLPRFCLVCERTSRGPLCFSCDPHPVFNLFPRCPFCFAPSINGRACVICASRKEIIKHYRFLWDYSGEARRFIKAMKFKTGIRLANLAGHILSSHINLLFYSRKWDLITYIPVTRSTLKERNFDQSYIIARWISKSLSIPLLSTASSLPNKKQSSLIEVSGRFKLKKRYCLNRKAASLIPNKRLLLVDDILTSGATTSEVAALLLMNGALEIDCLTLCGSETFYTTRNERLNFQNSLVKA